MMAPQPTLSREATRLLRPRAISPALPSLHAPLLKVETEFFLSGPQPVVPFLPAQLVLGFALCFCEEGMWPGMGSRLSSAAPCPLPHDESPGVTGLGQF